MEQTEHTAAGDTDVSMIHDTKSSSNNDASYAVVVKYDDCYLKSNNGILRLLHLVFVFLYLILAVSGGTHDGNYLSLPFAWHIRLIVFTCVVSLLVCIFVIGLNVTSTIAMLPVDWQLFDIVVYGVLALLYLLTVILLGVDIDNIDQYSQLIPQTTAHIHIAALVFGICCMLLHGIVSAVGLYQRIFLVSSSASHAILMSQHSSGSVTTAEGSGMQCA